ncbi:MAG: hypothetical protein AB7T31_14115 [Gemmatimonadales bacterium]
MSKRRAWLALSIAAAAAWLPACGREAPEPADAAPADAPRGVVDSIFPVEEELHRFQATLGPEPTRLVGGATSLDALVARFARAVEASDTAAFRDMLLTRDEFGWLYYPTTRFTVPPYRHPPALVWFEIENGSSHGLSRIFSQLAGRPLGMKGFTCPPEPRTEGRNEVLEGCVVRIEGPEGTVDATLFGSVLARDGVFKFVSYTNGI